MIVAEVIGIVYIKDKNIKVVPLEGSYYIPKVGDIIVGKIVDYNPVSWSVDIRAPYLARLEASDYLGRPIDPSRENINRFLDVGDLVIAKVAVTDRSTNPQLVAYGKGLGKITGGKIVYVAPPKIPRILGRNQSMIKMIRDITKADIKVGNNGVIWVKARNKELEELVIGTILKIERESHIPGLTERVREFLVNGMKKLELGDK